MPPPMPAWLQLQNARSSESIAAIATTDGRVRCGRLEASGSAKASCDLRILLVACCANATEINPSPHSRTPRPPDRSRRTSDQPRPLWPKGILVANLLVYRCKARKIFLSAHTTLVDPLLGLVIRPSVFCRRGSRRSRPTKSISKFGLSHPFPK